MNNWKKVSSFSKTSFSVFNDVISVRSWSAFFRKSSFSASSSYKHSSRLALHFDAAILFRALRSSFWASPISFSFLIQEKSAHCSALTIGIPGCPRSGGSNTGISIFQYKLFLNTYNFFCPQRIRFDMFTLYMTRESCFDDCKRCIF